MYTMLGEQQSRYEQVLCW